MDVTPEISDRLAFAAARLKAAGPDSPLEPPAGTPAAARLRPAGSGAPLTEACRELRRARTRLEELEVALAELWADRGDGLLPAA